MPQVGYALSNSAQVALAAGVAKTTLMLITPASHGVVLKRLTICLASVTPTDVSGMVELVTSTNATNSTPGTGNTTETANIQQIYGRVIALSSSFTAFGASTSEPTVLTSKWKKLLSPVGSTFAYDWPLGTEPDNAPSAGIGIRLTYPSAVNCLTSLEFERI